MFNSNDLKTVYLRGGLGNQLFQYCFYLYLKKEHLDVKISDVISNYQQQHQGTGLSDLIDIKFDDIEYKRLPVALKFGFLSKLLRKFITALGIENSVGVDLDLNADKLLLDYKKTSYTHYFGYYQDIEFVRLAKPILETQLINKFGSLLDHKKPPGKVAIHIRRGDFLNSKVAKHKQPLLTEYIKIFSENENKKFVVFSNDINWCKLNFEKFHNVEYSEGSSAIDDFLNFLNFEEYYLFGSTFSFFGAYLFSCENTVFNVLDLGCNSYMDELNNRK